MRKTYHLHQTFHIILDRFISTGKAPTYTEIATELGIPPLEGRKVLRRLFSHIGFPGWFHPKTDDIASFAPFSNVPNHHKLTIDGEQKWFGQ